MSVLPITTQSRLTTTTMEIRPPIVKPAQAVRPRLPEPIVIFKSWKSRNHTEHLRVDLSEYEGHPLINVRIWKTGSDGIDRPTIKGVAVSVRKLPELAIALARAETKARELGLIDAQDEASEATPLKWPKPRKLSKAERVKRALHQRVQQERSQVQAAAREAHLRSLMGLPTQQGRAK